MQDKKLDLEQIYQDIIDSSQKLIEDMDTEEIELLDANGEFQTFDLLFTFKINDVMYAICLDDEDALMVLRRDQRHRESTFSLVDSKHELVDVRDALEEITI